MKYEVSKAGLNSIEGFSAPGSMETIDSFSAPIPGQSLTVRPGSQAFEKPAEITDPDEAVMSVIERLEDDEEAKKAQLTQIGSGIPIEYIVNTIAFVGFSEGLWTPDVAELIKPPLAMYFILTAMGENIPMVVFNPRESKVGQVPQEEMFNSMSNLNPEGYDAVHQAVQQRDIEQQQQSEGFLGPVENMPAEGIPIEELEMTNLPEEGMI